MECVGATLQHTCEEGDINLSEVWGPGIGRKGLVVFLTLLLFSLSVLSDSLRPHGTAARQDPLSFTISWSLLKFMSIGSVMLSNHLILCSPLVLLPSIFPIIRIFSNELTLCIRWPKHWSFNFSNSCYCCSVTQSCLTLQPHDLQHARLPCPPLSPGVCSNS